MIANTIASLALSPLLLAQALVTRQRVPRWTEPPGQRRGHAGSGPSLKLLILGDSAAAGVGASHQREALAGQVVTRLANTFSLDWELDAVSGATTRLTLDRLAKRAPERFDVILTSLGVNDVVAHRGPGGWRAQQAELRQTLMEKFSARLVVISGLPPMHGFPALPQPLRWHLGWRATALDRWLQQDLAAEARCRYLSLRFTEDLTAMSGDGFHPGPRIYAEWGLRAADLIEEWARSI